MPIEEAEWTSISNLVEQEVGRLVGRRRDYFLISVVVKRDEGNNLVWVEEFGPTPIPMYCFDYEVIYYDTVASGSPYFTTNTVEKRYAKVRVLCPKVGETVLIAREMAADRLPRCLGVLKSKNYIIDEDEEND